jgi:hypothetical protein
MKKNKITVVEGEGSLKGKGVLSVTKDGNTTELSAKHIIVATGARARDLPFRQADGQRIWTYRHAMVPGRNADQIAGHRIGRDRGGIRQLLFGHGRTSDHRRDARTASSRWRMPTSPPSFTRR